MMKFRKPRFNDNGTIDCEVEHPEFGWIPFTASPDDVEESGKGIHTAILAAGVDKVLPAIPPSNEELAAEARIEREDLLLELDQFISNPLRWEDLSPEQKDEARAYRQALLDVPEQPNFPRNITWPEPPTFLPGRMDKR